MTLSSNARSRAANLDERIVIRAARHDEDAK